MQQAALFRREKHVGISVVLGFVVWVLSAIICEISGRHMGFFCRLIKYACMLFSRRWRGLRRENVALLHYFAEKDCLELVWFGGSSASSARSAGDIGVHCANNLSTLACYFPADSADYAEEYSFAALFRRERLFGVSLV